MNNYLEFLKTLYMNPKTLQSDFCRFNAKFVAESASRGHISSIVEGVSHNRWMVTKSGIQFITDNGKEVYK